MARKLLERITAAADLQEESVMQHPLVEIAGDRRVLIEHHHGVTQYGRCQIRVRVKYGAVVVEGTQLQLLRMCAEQLIISGKIDNIRLERSGN